MVREDVEHFLLRKAREETLSVPLILNLALPDDRKKLQTLISNNKINQVGDNFREQLKEYFQILHPVDVYQPGFDEKFGGYLEELEKTALLWQQGRWVYLPWLATVIHILEEDVFQRVRTARNRFLINDQEQTQFYNCVVGVAGLSVGNSVALTTVLQGGAKHIKLADFDRLALTNTNRIRAGVENLGLSKVVIAARQIYATNPYAEVELFPDGLTPQNVDEFFAGGHALDVVVDEIDNIALKFLLREAAKRYRVPVVMGADNGDNAVVDVERYDLNPNQEFFHGRIGNVSYEELRQLDKFGIGRTITKHIGPENLSARVQESLLAMGTTIVSWPQLGGAALLNGSAVSYCIRKIATGQPLENNRALVSLDEKLTPDYNSPEAAAERVRVADDFKKLFNL